MLGLGAGIDYALLIVGRYREQLAAGDDVRHAARVANATAGTSVIAAGAIVVVAIAGLLATGLPFVGQMGLGSAIIVAAVAVGAVTVLPVLMGAFAQRLRPRKPEHVAPSPGFARWGTPDHAQPVARRRRRHADPPRAGLPVHVAAPRPARRRQRRARPTTRQAYDTSPRASARLQRPARARGELPAGRTATRRWSTSSAPSSARPTWPPSRRRSSTRPATPPR